MTLKQVLEIADTLDHPNVGGKEVAALFADHAHCSAAVRTVHGDKGSTDFLCITIAGVNGRTVGGNNPTLGLIGRLGGIGARPTRIGSVSDGDGAVAVISAALKLAEMSSRGDRLPGDVIVTTHICQDAPTLPHEPVEFMDSPVEISTMNSHEVKADMDAVISVDTTKGNRVFNHRGIALSPTVKSGYVLKFSDDLVRLLEMTTGEAAHTFAVTTQDITPYGNGVFHINSILQPAVATAAPVVGLAITSASVVPGSATGASHETDVASAARFCIEAAKEFTAQRAQFYDADEYSRLTELYGDLSHLQTVGGGINA